LLRKETKLAAIFKVNEKNYCPHVKGKGHPITSHQGPRGGVEV
jgi:hypothetical protein